MSSEVDTSSEVTTQSKQEAALERARRVSELMDNAVELPVLNYKIGIDPIIGILPVAGDSVTTIASLYVVLEGIRAGASPRLVAIMLGLITIDFVAGSVPVLGTVFDAVWKANAWNVKLLERHVEESG